MLKFSDRDFESEFIDKGGVIVEVEVRDDPEDIIVSRVGGNPGVRSFPRPYIEVKHYEKGKFKIWKNE